MISYWTFWKLGWCALGFMVVTNLVLGLAFAGVAILLQDFFEQPVLIAAAIVWPLVGAPFVGWLFNFFAGATERVAGQR